jgi:hypothetical protein
MGKDIHLHIEQQNADGSYKHVGCYRPGRWTTLDNFIDGTDKHSLAWELTNDLPDDISPETDEDYRDGFGRTFGQMTDTEGFQTFLDKTKKQMATYSGEDEAWAESYLEKFYCMYEEMHELEKQGGACRIIFFSGF